MTRRTAHTRHAHFIITCVLGIITAGAPAFADPITLMWDANADTIAGYIVHVGAQSGAYTQHYDVGLLTGFTYPGAVAGQRYCFAVSAYNATGTQSALSGEVCGYSDAPPMLTNPGNRSSVVGTSVTLQLAGSDPYGQPVSYGATGLPPGLSLAPSTGFISGTGTAAGTYAVTARVFDGTFSASQTFSWTMTAGPPSTPAVSITGPTSSPAYATTSSSLTLRGTASAGAGVSQVSWMSDRGANGVATGTTSWATTSIPLQAGVNVFTVTARDTAGNRASDILSVTYSRPDSAPAAVRLTGRQYVQKERKLVALSWSSCSWTLVDVFRNGLRLTVTENDGSYIDSMKRGGAYTYKVCQTRNNAVCSNTVSVSF